MTNITRPHRPLVFRKYEIPILSMGVWPSTIPHENTNLVEEYLRLTAGGIFNPASIPNGTIHLYCRAETLKGENNILGFRTDKTGKRVVEYLGNVLPSGHKPGSFKHVGKEDPRGYFDWLTGKQYLSVVDNPGPTQYNLIAESTDYRHFNVVSKPFDDDIPDKDGAIWGRRKDLKPVYCRRKMVGDIWGMTIAVGETEDIRGPYKEIVTHDPHRDWEGIRTGASQAIELRNAGPNGETWFLEMHHGASMPGNNWLYPSGLALYDENGRMIACSAEPQITPTTEWEIRGFEDKQVSLCTGLELVDIDGVQFVRAYFGAGDRHVMVAEAPLNVCIDHLFRSENIVEGVESRSTIIQIGNLERILAA